MQRKYNENATKVLPPPPKDHTVILKVELSVGDLIFRNDDYKVYDLLPIKLELISH